MGCMESRAASAVVGGLERPQETERDELNEEHLDEDPSKGGFGAGCATGVLHGLRVRPSCCERVGFGRRGGLRVRCGRRRCPLLGVSAVHVRFVHRDARLLLGRTAKVGGLTPFRQGTILVVHLAPADRAASFEVAAGPACGPQRRSRGDFGLLELAMASHKAIPRRVSRSQKNVSE